ncbi:SpoIIE family protein phosphatase [Longimicrobium terrae]|uniref:Sigma-B regulation protein RsbU (Phosphoserine phosphatase) n=1 Tax=Longimicrobium terrae TaxID=1639882 RepID=A0A841GWE0_9BACT|nr:sigma-B regulation protein RsbU (phosphoserine phosphatase) [Longimicrobium terrae]MBB6070104.1 sigma-B regulation protein RsbU (phosphoserine phosphatase) [Longimicrobium terrae]NNC33007.1 SpoIIE family protein phosphatase [Longimicrobium terrae]
MTTAAASPPRLPASAREVLDDFGRAFGGAARVWRRMEDGWMPLGDGGGLPGPAGCTADVPGTTLAVELADATPAQAAAAAAFLGSGIARAARHDEEMRSFSREIAERYEEITLLYSISEILGSIISLKDAARTILAEVSSILGASRAALWVHDEDARVLRLAAVEGGEGQTAPIPMDDPCSVTAAVFREDRPVILGPGEEYTRADCPTGARQRGSFLSVPVSYSPPEGETRTIGVINLIGKAGNDGFSAGDMKLLSAIASQIGAAVENNRLIAESVRQERMERELELAHDLQLKLLPPLEQFAGYAQVAARCVPAESVGGDFYHLFRLPGNRLGVLIGDVSSHGFGAALIMALTISAVAIHASEGDAPSEVLHRTHRAVIDELENTEMYLTLFYGVIDPAAATLTYSNAGHGHAFRIRGEDGSAERLGATDPPFGIVDRDTYGEAVTGWTGKHDLLFLFTDGLSDALDAGEIEGERVLVDEASRMRADEPGAIMERLFIAAGEASNVPPDDRTAVVVRF